MFFDRNKSFNLNIVGIRRANAGTNKFDDFLAVLYKDKNLIYLNGDGEEEEIFNELRKKLDPITE